MKQLRVFISTVLTVSSSLLLPTNAQAIMLSGSVHDNVQAERLPHSASVDANKLGSQQRAQLLEGIWECRTQVTASSVPGVVPGASVCCAVRYERTLDGRMIELQEESGWTPSLAAVVKLSSEVMTVTHESMSSSRSGQDVNAKSQDQMRLVSPSTMVGQSVVTQYINGVFAGQYATSSVMHKVG